MTDTRIAALAEVLVIPYPDDPEAGDCAMCGEPILVESVKEFTAAIVAALPPDWCGHEDYRETPPCPFCGHREHREDICEQDLGEHGECQCADTRPRSDADIVRAAYDRLDGVNVAQATEIARLTARQGELNGEVLTLMTVIARLREIEEAARELLDADAELEEVTKGNSSDWMLERRLIPAMARHAAARHVLRAALATAKEATDGA